MVFTGFSLSTRFGYGISLSTDLAALDVVRFRFLALDLVAWKWMWIAGFCLV
jgi:hypothetical protein